jgi:glucose/mannose-6-phosphate isomerase
MACAGASGPVPIVPVKGFVLPGWAGPLDVVIAVSCSGRTEETLAVAEEAARRGCRLVTVGAERSPLARLGEQARAPHAVVAAGTRPPRANVWALSVPLLVIGESLGLLVASDGFTEAADRLDRIAEECGPGRDTATNPAKRLAAELSGTLPLVWASGDVADVAAYRLVCQLAENAKLPAAYGALPEIGHNGVVAFDGPFATGRSDDDDDIFRDRVEDPDRGTRMSVVLLRDPVAHPRVEARRRAVRAVADVRGVRVREVMAEGTSCLERLASLVGLGDYASTYLALGSGIDPTPIRPIDELKERIAL